MKVILEVGKFYRRENGVLVRYTPGDVFPASSDEFRHLEAKEQVFIRKATPAKEKEPAPTKAPVELAEELPVEASVPDEVKPPVDDDPVEPELPEDELLSQFTTRSGSWFVFEDGTKVQGRTKALEILRELYG